MNRNKTIYLVTFASLIALVIPGCANSAEPAASKVGQTERPAGWTEATHGNNVEPNYKVVFPDDKVNQIKITVAHDKWQSMQDNMVKLFGASGNRQQAALPGAGGMQPGAGQFQPQGGIAPGAANITRPQRPNTANITPGLQPGFNVAPGAANITLPQRPDTANITPGLQPGINIAPAPAAGQRVPGLLGMAQDNPDWVPATIEFNGMTWTNVGIRYKGNSSLSSSWRSGGVKMPFKIDFDEFEEEYPEIDNQRFYGFKQLSLSNVFNDSTYMHDVLTSHILAEAGLPASKAAYYEVILDYGQGEVNLGLYVVIEVIDDTVIDRYFGDDSGNIYEGDGRGVSLAEGTFNQIKTSFLKENNSKAADWSDIEELYQVLHSSSRTTDAAAWRQNLESIFDVDVFLEWLAVGGIIQHWDTYGSMTHNFCLYNNPATGQLTWISWDHNQVLAGGSMGGDANAGVGLPGGRAVTLARDEVTQQWPLIRYLLDDPVYHERYLKYIKETIDVAFNPVKLENKVRQLEKLIAPYVTKNTKSTAFQSAVQQLITRINERYQAAVAYLAAEGK
jgi:spore coat protein H